MKVLVTEPIHEKGIEVLNSCAEVVRPKSIEKADLLEAIKDCDAVLTRVVKIDKELMENAPKLKAVAKHGVGVDNIDQVAATANKVMVLNAPFSNLNAVAEQAATFILCLMREVVYLNNEVKAEKYAEVRKGVVLKELTDKKIGLIGFGKIPQRVKELLTPFGAKFMVYDPYLQNAPSDVEVAKSLDELFSSCLIVSVHTPLTDSTANMINSSLLDKCNGTYLVNTSRGGIAVEKDVIAALDSGKLAGYATDVFEAEPPKAGDALVAHPKVICSPHCAALTDNALVNMAVHAAEGIKDALLGKKPEHVVNKDVLKELGL